jgi:hypothetical protein
MRRQICDLTSDHRRGSGVNFPTWGVKNIVPRMVSGVRACLRPLRSALSARTLPAPPAGRGANRVQHASSVSSGAIRGRPAVAPGVAVLLSLALARVADARVW